MWTPAPLDRMPTTLSPVRAWALPAAVLGIILATSFLPTHGVTSLVDVLAATVAALGLVAASLAAPLWARAAVEARGGSLSLAPARRQGSEASARRRLAAVAVGAAVSTAGVAATASLLMSADSLTAGHAVLLIALYANASLLLSNVVPMPPWPGWALLVALIDLRPPPERTVDRAVPIARGLITVEAAAIVALAIGSGDWPLLLLSGLLVLLGWTQTTLAKADNAIDRYLVGRRVSQVAREVAAIAAPDEPALAAIARCAAEGAVIAVQEGNALLGAIGPRQARSVSPSARRARCADVMVSVGQLEILRREAPARFALGQLDRFGFALVLEPGRLSYVEVNDLLTRILLTAAVAHAVRTNNDAGGDTAQPGSPKSHR